MNVTLPTVLASLREAKVLPLAESIAREYGVSLSRLLTTGRGARSQSATVVRARHHLWLLHRHTLMPSYPEMARMYGVDHTSIMHGVKRLEREIQERYGEPYVAQG